MSSFGAAQAASARVPNPVIARVPLFTGPVIKIKVPITATRGAYPAGDTEIPYLQFCVGFRGGRVHFFVHSPDDAMLGKRLTAFASVHKKTLEDGQEYLYVDLAPALADTPVTHRLDVMSGDAATWENDENVVFRTPPPHVAAIVFSPPDAKLVEAPVSTTTAIPAAPKPHLVYDAEAPKKPTTGDSQLDRLLEAGWEIDSEDKDKSQVNLFRMVGERRKTMVHYGPKPKPRHKHK